MKKPSLEKIIESIEIPENLDHKKALKKHLMLEAEELYSKNTAEKFCFKQLFQWGFVLTGMAVFVALISFPWNAKPAEPDYFTFIEKAQAFAEANKSKIHYYKISSNSSLEDHGELIVGKETEIWSDEKGYEVWKTKTIEDSSVMNSQGDWVYIPSATNIIKHDPDGNEFIYTKLIQIGTKKSANPDGVAIQEPEYLTIAEKPEYLGDPQPVDAKKELETIASTVYCLNTEEDKNMIGVSTIKISGNGEIGYPQQNIAPKDKRYQIVSDLAKAFEGRLSKNDLLNILGDYKDSPLVQHEYIKENGENYYKVSLNTKDFSLTISPSLEDGPVEKPDSIYSFYFNADTYALERLEVIDQLHKTKNINLFEDKYLENFDENELFNTKDFVLVHVTSGFEAKFNQNSFMDGSINIAKGCYKNNQPLNKNESEKYLENINKHFEESEKTPWNIEQKKSWEQPLGSNSNYKNLQKLYY